LPSSTCEPAHHTALTSTSRSLERQNQTNISTLARAISPTGSDGVLQVVCYDAGVGTTGGETQRFLTGIVGAGIDLNIKQLYTFLVLNYTPGDEIYLFGFSRGAYTVRSLAGLMHEAGLLRREHHHLVGEAYELYRNLSVSADSDTAKAFRAENGTHVISDRVPIKLLACFDTVGALGIPFASPPFMPDWNASYRFHDTALSHAVENAIHIMSIDEDRKAFAVTRMSVPEGSDPSMLTQLFMAGVHTGVGGGSGDELQQTLAGNALKVLVGDMERRGLGLSLDSSVFPQEFVYDVGVPTEKPGFSFNRWLFYVPGRSVRNVASVDDMHVSAIRRYQLVEGWRPPALEKLTDELEAFDTSTRGI